MKRKQLLGTVIPVFMMTAVITSGYAIWHYNNLMTSASQSLNTEVTQHVEIGTVSTASQFSIVFDQTENGRKNALTSDSTMNSSDISADLEKFEARGIYLNWNSNNTTNKYSDASATEGTKTKATYTSPSIDGAVDYSTDNQELNTFFDVVIDFGSDLNEYVEISDSANANANFTKSTSSTKTIFSSTNKSNATFNKEFDWTLVTFAYKENKEPANNEAYKAFLDKVDGKTITVTYYAYIDSNAHTY